MTTILMCPPTNFGVTYDINPWMTSHVGEPTPGAAKQWERLVETLRSAGDVRIELVDPQPGLPDLVFTANAALVSGQIAIVSSFRFEERRGEQNTYRAALAKLGFATTFLHSTFFEGAGDALFDRRRPLLYVGYGWRTDRVASLQISETLGVRTVPLFLANDRFYHLDTCLCPLGSGHVMIHMPAFSPHSQRLLRSTIESELLIEVELEDAAAFACNSVEIGASLVMHSASAGLRAQLKAAGYEVLTSDLSEFQKAGGSAKCLTLKLEDGPVTVEAAA